MIEAYPPYFSFLSCLLILENLFSWLSFSNHSIAVPPPVMLDQHPVDSLIQYNQKTLNEVARAIRLSQGQFSLILLHCNYTGLQKQISQWLQTQFAIREITLEPWVDRLYTTLDIKLDGEQPPAVIVFGLESVTAIDQLLNSSNQVRENFRNSFAFPILLWINDRLLKKLIRLVPDIWSWTTRFRFSMTDDELVTFLESNGEKLFTTVLEVGAGKFVTNASILGESCAAELESAYQELQNNQITLNSHLIASLQFILGRYYYSHHQIELAIQHYQESLTEFGYPGTPRHRYPPLAQEISLSVKLGVVLYHLGLSYCHLAEEQHLNTLENLQQARSYFEQCIQIFELAHRPELVAKFINALSHTLSLLEDWSQLWELGKKARHLHQSLHNFSVQLSQDYGFLAQVKLQQHEWQEAQELAELALEVLIESRDSTAQVQYEGLYRLIIAQAQTALHQHWRAIQHLEMARDRSHPKYDPKLYLQILRMLHDLYFELSDYRAAFHKKQEVRAIEAQYGFRAFIGAGRLQPRRSAIYPNLEAMELATESKAPFIADEITAAGRKQDVEHLIARISSTQYKLTVIYGESGVGKSSLVMAGLMPALKHRVIEARQVLPIVLPVYRDWITELGRRLHLAQAAFGADEWEPTPTILEGTSLGVSTVSDRVGHEPEKSEFPAPESAANSLLAQFKKNAALNFLTVVIFDQFEEFFLTDQPLANRQELFEFLGKLLNIPYIKLILSLRQDYLHYLLEFGRVIDLEMINNDILSKDNLSYLGNFSRANAHHVIQTLTERSHFYLEPALIQQLVTDLANEVGEVRPIELQVVGSQLQESEITTLSQYKQLGAYPKQALVEQFLQEVVRDCGPENEMAALLVLYSLIDENNTRPLKTRAELAADLAVFGAEEKLDLVLEILVESGLIFRWQESSTELYQLVHDYLADFIRQQQRLNEQAELQELRERDRESQVEIELLKELQKEQLERQHEQQKAQKEQQQLHDRLKMVLQSALAGSLLTVGVLAILSLYTFYQKQRAEIAETKALTSASDALIISGDNDQLKMLMTSVLIGESAQYKSPETQQKITEKLRQTVAEIQEKNRFSGHTGSVLDVTFSPDGQTLASSGLDKTVKLWKPNGELLQTWTHSAAITKVTFNPAGTWIAAGTADDQVKIWRTTDGTEVATLKEHTEMVQDVKFSPNGQQLLTASADQTVKLWDLESSPPRVVTTFTGHSDWVYSVDWRADGNMIASSSHDGTIKVWDLQGKLLKTLKVPGNTSADLDNAVFSIRFSPDGETLAAGYSDKTIKLWNLESASIRQIFNGHSHEVRSIAFSEDGKTLVSASADQSVKLWSRDGTLLNTLDGHQGIVWQASLSPNGSLIASASADQTVKLWSRDSTPLRQSLKGHQDWVYHAEFSSNGREIVSGSYDRTIRVWSREGALISTWENPDGAVRWVSFSPDGKLIAAASQDDTIKLWSRTGTLLQTFKGHQEDVLTVSFSPIGDLIASGSLDKTVKLWQLDGTLVTTVSHDEPVNQVVFSPDGKLIASASADQSVKLWRRDGTIRATFPHDQKVTSVRFHPNGQQIVTAAGRRVRLWDIQTEQPVFVEETPENITSVTFNPDGRLITVAAGTQVLLWDVQTQQKLTLDHRDVIQSVSFSPDGQTMVLSSNDKTLILWQVGNLDLQSLIERGCEWLQDYLQYGIPNLTPEDQGLCLSFRS